MNTENLEVGMVFKNYGELCNALGIIPKSSNSKKAQLKEMDRRFKIEKGKERHSLVITEIFKEILPKKENQGNLPVYIQYMELLLLKCLQQEESKKLLVSNIKLAEKLKMIHSDYSKYYDKKNELSNILNVDLAHVQDFITTTSNGYINAIKTILRRLESRSIILYETRWKTVEKKSYIVNDKIKRNVVTRFATDKEKDVISKIRYDILQNYGGTMRDVYKSGSLNEYQRLYSTRLQYELGIDDAYKVYDININKKAVHSEYYKTMKNLMETTNDDELTSIINRMWYENNEQKINKKQQDALDKFKNDEPLNRMEEVRISNIYIPCMGKLNSALTSSGVNKVDK